jgi:hypothetical protein
MPNSFSKAQLRSQRVYGNFLRQSSRVAAQLANKSDISAASLALAYTCLGFRACLQAKLDPYLAHTLKSTRKFTYKKHA